MTCDFCYDSDFTKIVKGESDDLTPMYYMQEDDSICCLDCLPEAKEEGLHVRERVVEEWT